MAKSSNRGGGPGTADRGGVRTTMDSPWKNGSSVGSGNKMSAPFNGGSQPAGIPLKIYETSLGGKAPAASTRDSLDTIKTNPKDRGR